MGYAALIERGILARPIPVRVRTQAEVERGLKPRDLERLTSLGDFSPELLGRIGRIEHRNRAIVDHYLKNRGRYGKTLIFASNVTHAALLADRLRAAGTRADYVASHRHDHKDNRAILDRFRCPSGPEVLISVNLLAEGVDLPAVQAVLLGRPTVSEILLRQMLGRALRGPAVGGTE